MDETCHQTASWGPSVLLLAAWLATAATSSAHLANRVHAGSQNNCSWRTAQRWVGVEKNHTWRALDMAEQQRKGWWHTPAPTATDPRQWCACRGACLWLRFCSFCIFLSWQMRNEVDVYNFILQGSVLLLFYLFFLNLTQRPFLSVLRQLFKIAFYMQEPGSGGFFPTLALLSITKMKSNMNLSLLKTIKGNKMHWWKL